MKLLASFFLLFSISLAAQTDTIIDGKKFSHIDYYDNGKVKSIGNYKDNKKDGSWKYFYKSGKVLEYGSYTSGKRIGTWVNFDKERNKQTIKYKKKNINAETEEYDEEGNIRFSVMIKIISVDF